MKPESLRIRLFVKLRPFVLFFYLVTVPLTVRNHDWFRLLNAVLMVAGMQCNFTAISSNGWKMPSKLCGYPEKEHCALTQKTKHKWLCDRIYLYFAFVSIGDLLMLAGALSLLFSHYK